MSKKIIVFFGIFLVLVVGGMIILSRTPQKTNNPLGASDQVIPEPTSAEPVAQKEYTDPSGFKFSYPENFTIDAKDVSKDNTLYADITLSSPIENGQLTIKVADATKTFFDESLKDKSTIETKLADIEAFQYQDKNKLITTAYDQGVQFTFTTDLSQEKNYWFDVNKQIVGSFVFVKPQAPAETSGTQNESDGGIIFEGEETIQ